MHTIKLMFMAPLFLASLLVPTTVTKNELPEFRVVLDPGHGGVSLRNRKNNGDRFDIISGKYMMPFAEGASYGKLHEHVLVYQIAEKTKKILDMCAADGDFDKFAEIVKKYSDDPPVRINIAASLSRGSSLDREEIKNRNDANAEFRLYDFFNGGERKPGRISRINGKKPHLVVSLHMTNNNSGVYRGMNPVIIPPYSLMFEGLRYLKGERSGSSFIRKTPYRHWFQESDSRSSFEWFLNDVAFYFISYPITRQKDVRHELFKGYRYNMISWSYRDEDGWEDKARSHPPHTRFDDSYRTFVPEGKFWQRERSQYEEYRRSGGIEGFGGDNYYATMEIMRYILLSLHLRGLDHPSQRISRPYISTWSVPLHVNAIAAFIELASLNEERHRMLYTQKQDLVAEGIAVGIYSLLAGTKPRKTGFAYTPRGKPLNLDRYRASDNRTYFDNVVE